MIKELLNGLSKITTTAEEIKPDLLLLHFTIVTACIAGNKDKWILVDTGLENSFDFIVKSADDKFGKGSRPEAIILTHGHFDHVGSLKRLSEYWDVPVYVHELEIPYITGKKDYPLGDPTVDEGLVAKMSQSFPHSSIDIGFRAVALQSNGVIPGTDEWKWIHTPGHTEGHVSLFRDSDKTIIVGDAFSTTKQESFLSVLTQQEEIKGPPAYLTVDWEAAKKSIEIIKNLKPELAIPSHGKPMEGMKLTNHLELLARDFNEIAVPNQGRYVDKQH